MGLYPGECIAASPFPLMLAACNPSVAMVLEGGECAFSLTLPRHDGCMVHAQSSPDAPDAPFSIALVSMPYALW